jgi:protein gp37
MAVTSKIEWTEATWNPLTGCKKISPGCKFCYAERLSLRLQAMGRQTYKNGFDLTLQEAALELPLRWRKPKTIFVNSMSDLFQAEVAEEFIQRVFRVMARATWHRFQVLTKRADRLAQIGQRLPWTANIWMGVSVEHQDYAFRIDYLRQVPARVRFVSLEPLLGPLPALNLNGIDWVIVGGESGPGARTMEPAWVTDIQEQCRRSHTPFFFKQWGGINKQRTGRILAGRTWDEMPVAAQPQSPLFDGR